MWWIKNGKWVCVCVQKSTASVKKCVKGILKKKNTQISNETDDNESGRENVC